MGIVLEEGKEAHGRALDGGLGQGRIGGGMEDAAVAEDGEPGKDEAQRDEHHAEDEFAQGAAARDAGDEQPHERCPGHPPGPEEDGPGGFPGGALCAFVGVGLEGLDRQCLEVVADVLHHGVEQELRGTGKEQGDDQQDGGQHVELGQPASTRACARPSLAHPPCLLRPSLSGKTPPAVCSWRAMALPSAHPSSWQTP